MGEHLSPLYPIFWPHHANIDRIWARWELAHPGADPTDPVWLGKKLAFDNGAGKQAEYTPGGLTDVRRLGYRYPDIPEARAVQAGPPAGTFATAGGHLRASVAAQVERAVLSPGGGKVTVLSGVIDPSEPLRQRPDAQAGPARSSDATVRLVIEDMAVDPGVKFGVRVFLNAPDLGKLEGVADPHYVGTVHLFGLEHAGHGGAWGRATRRGGRRWWGSCSSRGRPTRRGGSTADATGGGQIGRSCASMFA